MFKIAEMMKQAQNMQKTMTEVQQSLALQEIEGSLAGGLVKIVHSGGGEMRSISIDKSLLNNPDDVSQLEDLIVVAYNDAKSKTDNMANQEMEKVTGGLSLPKGFKLPF